jgi:NMD protein affecting ribosome stability and mRNA decay
MRDEEEELCQMCDYPKASKVWESLVRVRKRWYFDNHNWYAWLISNLSLRNRYSHNVD